MKMPGLRLNMMALLLGALFIISAGPANQQIKRPVGQPNIILIVAGDLGRRNVLFSRLILAALPKSYQELNLNYTI
jgi:hypothetical protein